MIYRGWVGRKKSSNPVSTCTNWWVLLKISKNHIVKWTYRWVGGLAYRDPLSQHRVWYQLGCPPVSTSLLEVTHVGLLHQTFVEYSISSSLMLQKQLRALHQARATARLGAGGTAEERGRDVPSSPRPVRDVPRGFSRGGKGTNLPTEHMKLPTKYTNLPTNYTNLPTGTQIADANYKFADKKENIRLNIQICR